MRKMGLNCLDTCFSLCGCPPLMSGYRKQRDLFNSANSYIALDTQFMGEEAIVLKCGTRLCGSGGVLLNVPLIQDKSYFEVKVQQSSGQWGVGVATRDADLSHPPLGRDFFSWVLRSTGQLFHDDKCVAQINSHAVTRSRGDMCSYRCTSSATNGVSSSANSTSSCLDDYPVLFEDGDVLGVSYDHMCLQFYLGGNKLENATFYNIKGGHVYPLLYVQEDAILDIKVNDFFYKPPRGFGQILREKSIL